MKKYLCLVLVSALFLSACGKKNTTTTTAPSPTPKLMELAVADRPQVSLTPRSDGHELTLKVSSISNISKIEYEILYFANDGGLEIEKGASGIIESKDISSGTAERKILLGTESCTNGCKYKYDTGITGGNINLKFTTTNSQLAIFDSPFILRTSAEIKKAGKLIWTEENFNYSPSKLTGNNFFIAHKDYKNGAYMVTSSGSL